MNRKRVYVTAILIVLFVMATISVYSQTQAELNEQVLTRLGFTDDEIKGLMAIQEETQKTIVLAKAEMDIYRAELKKLLLNPDVNMKDVEKILRQSMEWELKMRLAQIKREVESRKLVGDKKWARLVQYLRKVAQRKKLNRVNNNVQRPKAGAPRLNPSREERIKALIRELEKLLEEPKN